MITFSQISTQEKTIKQLKLLKLSEYLEYFKGYSKNALILSTHSAVRYIASLGGSITESGNPRNWICTNPNAPSVNEVRYYLSESTNRTLNEFVKRMNQTKEMEIVSTYIGRFGCVDYDVSASSVNSGENDEAFNVGGYGSYLTLRYQDDIINSTNDIYEQILKVRFWYMYRIFKEWADEDTIKIYLCGCLEDVCNSDCDSNPFKSCYENALELARQDLQRKFDEYVTCTVTFPSSDSSSGSSFGGAAGPCCYVESEECVDVKRECEGWDAPKCNRCDVGRPKTLCSYTIQLKDDKESFGKKEYFFNNTYQYSPRFQITPIDKCSLKKCEYWQETREAIEAIFSCKDNKYLLSTEGDRQLTFTVYVSVSLKGKHCYKSEPCQCSGIVDPITGECIGTCECKQGTWCTGCQ